MMPLSVNIVILTNLINEAMETEVHPTGQYAAIASVCTERPVMDN